MKRNLRISMAVMSAGLMTGTLTPAFASDSRPVSEHNDEMNRYDRKSSSVTADQAKNGHSDIELMQKIRKAVQRDDLSTSAKNVKIIAVDGHVTLSGAVRTAKEKDLIEKEAVRFAGAENVNNEIMVQGK